jgi:hypothetical protein
MHIQDGGHLLLRLTQLPAAGAADIIPPTATTSTASTASSAGSTAAGGTSGTPSSLQQQRVAAAAAAVAGPAGVAGSTLATVEEADEGLQDKMWGLLSQAQGQVRMSNSCVVSYCHNTTAAQTHGRADTEGRVDILLLVQAAECAVA